MKNLFLVFILLGLVSCGGSSGGGSTDSTTTTQNGGDTPTTCNLDSDLVGFWSHNTVNATMEINGTTCKGYNDYCNSIFYIQDYSSEVNGQNTSGTAVVNVITTDTRQGCVPVGSYAVSFAFGPTVNGSVLVFTINGNDETYNKID